MTVILWFLALILGVVGVVQLFQGQFILGIVLIVVALGIGPGGFSFFKARSARA